ncbi:MAG: WD40 repeat domain-containing protein [Zavarzinella sp.]
MTRLLCCTLVLLGIGIILYSEEAKPAPQPKTIFHGHEEAIYAVAFHPKAKFAATASFDHKVNIWDTTDGRLVREFSGPKAHNSLVLAVDFDHTGDRLATGGSDNRMMIWDFPRETPMQEWDMAAPGTTVATSPDGKLVAVGNQQGKVKLWQVADGKSLIDLQAHQAAIQCLHMNNTILLTATAAGEMKLWNIADAKLLAVWHAHMQVLHAAKIHPSQPIVYTTGADGHVKFWQYRTNINKEYLVPGNGITNATISTDGNTLYAYCKDNTLRQINLTNGQVARTYTGLEGTCTALAVFPNNSYLIAGNEAGVLYCWTNSNGQLLAKWPGHSMAVQYLQTQTNNTQFISSGKDGVIRLWNIPKEEKKVALPAVPATASYTPDDARLVISSTDKIVRLCNASTGAVEKQFTGLTLQPTSAIVHRDNQHILTSTPDGRVQVWNINSSQQVGVFDGHTGIVPALTSAPNGQVVATGGEDGTLKVWAMPPTKPVTFAHASEVEMLVISADGNRIWTVASDKQIRTWPTNNPSAQTLLTAKAAIRTFAVSSDGNRIAYTTDDGVLNLRDGAKDLPPVSLKVPITSITWSANNQTVLAGGNDGNIYPVKLSDGKELPSAKIADKPVRTLIRGGSNDWLFCLCDSEAVVRIHQSSDLKFVKSIDTVAGCKRFVVSKDGKLLCAVSDKQVIVREVETNKQLATKTLEQKITSCAISPDGQRISIGLENGKVMLLDQALVYLESFTHDKPVTDLVFHLDNKRLLSSSSDKQVQMWSPQLKWATSSTKAIRSVAISANSDRIAFTGDDAKVHLLEISTAKQVAEYSGKTVGKIVDFLGTANDHLVTAWNDAEVQLWKASETQTSWKVLGSPVNVKISADAKMAAVVSQAGANYHLQVFAISPQVGELQAARTWQMPISAVHWLKDNRTLNVSLANKEQWSFDTPGMAALVPHQQGTPHVGLHLGQNFVYTIDAEHAFKKWDFATLKEVAPARKLPQAADAFAISTDATLLAVAQGKNVVISQVTDGKVVAEIALSAKIDRLQFSTNKQMLLVESADQLVSAYDVATGQFRQGYQTDSNHLQAFLHPTQPQAVIIDKVGNISIQQDLFTRDIAVSGKELQALSISSNGASLAVGGSEGIAYQLNTGNGNIDRKYEAIPGKITGLDFSNNSQLLAVASDEKLVRMYQVNVPEPKELLKTPWVAKQIQFSPNGQMLLGIGDDDQAIAWDVAFQINQPTPPNFGKVVQTMKHPGKLAAAVFASDSIIFTNALDNKVRQWKLASMDPLVNLNYPNIVDTVAWSEDGKQIAVGVHNGQLFIYDLEKKNNVRTIEAHRKPADQPIYRVQWVPGKAQILTTSLDQTMKIWDATNGNMVKEFKAFDAKTFPRGHQDQVFAAAFSKDGQLIASGSNDRTLKLWRVSDATVIREFQHPDFMSDPGRSHPGGIYSIRFTPDQTKLITSGPGLKGTGHIAIWSVNDGKLLQAWNVERGPVYGIDISPDGKWIIAGCGPRVRQSDTPDALMFVIP